MPRPHVPAPLPLLLLLVLVPLLMLPPSPARGCVWHRDTDYLEEEGRDIPDVIDVIAGRFERNPSLYYEMRLERVTRELAEDPSRLSLYDDAGVACDRLGRGDEAIEWMTRKLAELERPEVSRDAAEIERHRYRYLANLGTFHAHRWSRAGTDFTDLADIERARELIAEAIRLNPDAHFGRERYQLLALEWIRDLAGEARTNERATSFLRAKDGSYPGGGPVPEWYLPGAERSSDLQAAGFADAAIGTSGLVALGEAWESVDVFNALQIALMAEGKSWVALLAYLRLQEIVASGKRSLRETATSEPTERLLRDSEISFSVFEGASAQAQVKYEGLYSTLRAEADAWHAARTDFMLERLRAGKHPDTDPDFWDGYVEAPRTTLAIEPIFEKEHQQEARRREVHEDHVKLRRRVLWVCSAGVGVFAVVFAWAIRRESRKRR